MQWRALAALSGVPTESQVRAAADDRTLAHAELAGTYAR